MMITKGLVTGLWMSPSRPSAEPAGDGPRARRRQDQPEPAGPGARLGRSSRLGRVPRALRPAAAPMVRPVLARRRYVRRALPADLGGADGADADVPLRPQPRVPQVALAVVPVAGDRPAAPATREPGRFLRRPSAGRPGPASPIASRPRATEPEAPGGVAGPGPPGRGGAGGRPRPRRRGDLACLLDRRHRGPADPRGRRGPGQDRIRPSTPATSVWTGCSAPRASGGSPRCWRRPKP